MTIPIKTPAEIEKMRAAGQLASKTLSFLEPHIKAGVTTEHLDQLAHDFIVAHHAIPAPLNYHGFPKSICTSINHVVCHGIPAQRVLKKEDIINVDVTVILDGFHGDSSRMYCIGKPSIKGQRICHVAYECLVIGIQSVKPGATLGDIGHAIQTHAESNYCSVVRDYCGHGIGREFHEEPQVTHYGEPGQGEVLEPGMTFTIEPMINLGGHEVKLMPDGWTVITKDRSLSAQWEHTLLVTPTGYEVLTLREGEVI
jgi:methionyl aminopeptidase